ncbi:PREDICTED: uncharacterized protein LOC108363512 [Rhagoletis zephyria]|uniref:uncharacterized protein LOC108363512 n=1 Tax=Rhagoletis zephyria TaxID=28612 RepID=UPI000811843E|nr:PREDICTED: uncharacterized protein LOC108363512 [Rhagoletis zephyria]
MSYMFKNLTSVRICKRRVYNVESLLFGLGLLHAEIKAFEHLLHLSYRLLIKTWDVRANLQDTFIARKKAIQKVLYDRLRFKVDLCLQGHGTTNTGNLAGRCFSEASLFAECLELDYTLVKNIAHILICFAICPTAYRAEDFNVPKNSDWLVSLPYPGKNSSLQML